MRRAIFIVLLVLFSVGIAAAGFAWQRANAISDTAADSACEMIVVHGTPDIQLGMAVASLYEQIPQMQTPVVMVATQEKPFTVGCLAAGE